MALLDAVGEKRGDVELAAAVKSANALGNGLAQQAIGANDAGRLEGMVLDEKMVAHGIIAVDVALHRNRLRAELSAHFIMEDAEPQRLCRRDVPGAVSKPDMQLAAAFANHQWHRLVPVHETRH